MQVTSTVEKETKIEKNLDKETKIKSGIIKISKTCKACRVEVVSHGDHRITKVSKGSKD